MEIWSLLIFAVSLLILWKGGLLLVRGASGIASFTGIGPFLAGFTVVALGTSVPEFMVSLVATVMNSSDIAVGNMIGSNIANVGLVFGLTVLISPIVIDKEAWKEQKHPLAFLVLITFASYGFSREGFSIGRVEGVLLFFLLAVFFFVSYRKSREEKNRGLYGSQVYSGWKLIFYIVSGSALLAIGAYFVVSSAVNIAEQLGISELFIGVVVVALGTSLPELATSLAAAWKKEQSIVLGNIIGSSFFNLGYLGLIAVIRPIDVNQDMFGTTYEFWFLLALTVLFAVLVGKTQLTRNRIGKKKGALLLVVYIAFLYFVSGSFS